jgi:hypothetical protein
MYIDMKVVVQIYVVLFSAMGGQMMNNNCGNDGSGSLQRCKNHSNIRIEKIPAGGRGNDINRYKLSLYSQTASSWWEPPTEIKWIECKDLCTVCESLPGISNGENVC